MQSKKTLLSLDLVPSEIIESKILLIRSKKVMLGKDLASLYKVTTGNLNKAVKRNIDRFPEDFMFQLNKDETDSLSFQFGSLKRGEHFKYLPYAFTEQGVAMLSSVLNSKRAVHVNIAIMRTFVKFHQIISTHKELAYKLAELERKIEKHDEYIKSIFDAIRELMVPPPEKPRRQIGFHVE